jgi:hypothetical protein
MIKTPGGAILALGLLVLVYGIVACWRVPSLPPNGGPRGRLPSLYMIGVGIVITIAGLAARGGSRRGGSDPAAPAPRGIPAASGIVILLAILGGLFFLVSRL